jgi:hypothetical protein
MPNVNFATLQQEIASAARQAFTEIRNDHPSERFYAFALYTDDSAMTVEPAANSEEALESTAEDYDESPDTGWLRWGTAEWAYESEGGDHFNDVYDALNVENRYDKKDPKAFGAFKQNLFETMILALKSLDDEGFFGTGKDREAVTLFCSVSDSDDAEDLEDQSAKRLNSKAVYRRFKASRE